MGKGIIEIQGKAEQKKTVGEVDKNHQFWGMADPEKGIAREHIPWTGDDPEHSLSDVPEDVITVKKRVNVNHVLSYLPEVAYVPIEGAVNIPPGKTQELKLRLFCGFTKVRVTHNFCPEKGEI